MIRASEFAADSFPAVEAGGIEAGAKPASPSGLSQDSGPGDAVPAGGSSQEGTGPEEPFGVSQSLTPSGIEVYYQSGPKRLYRVRDGKLAHEESVGEDFAPWHEVPSVTTVLGVIDKSGALTWWGQGVGGIGALKLQQAGEDLTDVQALIAAGSDDDARKLLCSKLTEHKLSTNHVRDKASDRGVSVHDAFEQWAGDQRIIPQPIVYPEHERGYVAGLAAFLKQLAGGEPDGIQAEVTVASLEHRFAGRYDLRLNLRKTAQVVTRIYPQRQPKIEVIPEGSYLLDLKTSKGIYDTHYLQLEAYEGASVECGYEPTDWRGVIHVTADGRYELHINQLKNAVQPWAHSDFLAARELYGRMNEVKR